MSMSAFTNLPGTYQRHEYVEGYQEGKWYGWEGRERTYQTSHLAERCMKAIPHPAHKRYPTNWTRSVAKVTVNKPMIYHRYQTEGNAPDEYVVVDLKYEDHITNYHYPLTSFLPIPGSTNAVDESVVEALNNLNENKAELGAALATARQTTDMFASRAAKLAASLRAIRRGNWQLALEAQLGLRGKHVQRRNAAGNTWLEYQYGWLPLVSDLHETQKIVHDVLSEMHQVEGYGKGQASASKSLLWEGWLDHEWESETTARTTLRGLVENKSLHLLNGAGLINPLSIAWELVPYSFMIDWFMPVGQTLSAMTAAYGLQSQGGWTSIKTNESLTVKAVTTSGQWPTNRIDGGQVTSKRFSFDRKAYADFPKTRFFADLTPFSTARALNAAALVRSLR